jgi:hypothetical protein
MCSYKGTLLSAIHVDMTFTKVIFKCSLGLILVVSICFNGPRFIMCSITLLQVVVLDLTSVLR